MAPMSLYVLVSTILVTVGFASSPDVSCGALLPAVAAQCGYPDKPGKTGCCDALKSFHRADCWCDAAAFAALRRISTNAYAFSGRAASCGLKSPKLPAIPPVRRGVPPPTVTCPDMVIEPPLEKGCEDPNQLQNKRLDALNRLDALMLPHDSKKDVDEFRTTVGKMLSPMVVFSNVGQVSIIGSRAVGDYLLSRQRAMGARADFPTAAKRDTAQWRSPRSASNIVYVQLADETDEALTARMEFVIFEKCSERITSLTFAEAPFLSAQYSQYFYVRDGHGVVDQFDGCEKRVCERIRKGCRGKLFPYKNMRECKNFAAQLKRSGKVMCNRFEQNYVPQVALHGDSLACRSTYATVARIDPEKYCPWLGKDGKGACQDTACPNKLYSDIFAQQGEPRISGDGGTFSCSRKTGICSEQWL